MRPMIYPVLEFYARPDDMVEQRTVLVAASSTREAEGLYLALLRQRLGFNARGPFDALVPGDDWREERLGAVYPSHGRTFGRVMTSRAYQREVERSCEPVEHQLGGRTVLEPPTHRAIPYAVQAVARSVEAERQERLAVLSASVRVGSGGSGGATRG